MGPYMSLNIDHAGLGSDELPEDDDVFMFCCSTVQGVLLAVLDEASGAT